MTQLCETFIEGWRNLAATPRSPFDGETPDIRACLILDGWDENPIAAAIQARYPDLAQDRCPVPDPHFEHREDDAPCLVPLPADLAPAARPDTSAAAEARDQFAQWIAQAWQQSGRRLARQSLGGVVLGSASAATIARHWVDLGHQRPPDGSPARLFRFQDARVMQRVWPKLTPSQRRHWLGPVLQWWALVQPWGPWNAGSRVAGSDPSSASSQAEWFCTAIPTREEHRCDPPDATVVRALLDRVQWQAAHSAPVGSRVWARYAEDGVPIEDQPDGDVMERLIADGHRLGLKDVNLEDYVWCTWRVHARDDGPRERPWHSPRGTAILAYVLDALGRQPLARFASLYAEALTRR